MMNEKQITRKGFLVGGAAAAAGLSLLSRPLAAASAAGKPPLPAPGEWPYALLDPHECGEWAAHGVRDEAGELTGPGKG
jgi:hypothetical protein